MESDALGDRLVTRATGRATHGNASSNSGLEAPCSTAEHSPVRFANHLDRHARNARSHDGERNPCVASIPERATGERLEAKWVKARVVAGAVEFRSARPGTSPKPYTYRSAASGNCRDAPVRDTSYPVIARISSKNTIRAIYRELGQAAKTNLVRATAIPIEAALPPPGETPDRTVTPQPQDAAGIRREYAPTSIDRDTAATQATYMVDHGADRSVWGHATDAAIQPIKYVQRSI
jgi:hypothetical protein